MRRLGVEVAIVNLESYRLDFQKYYPNLDLRVIYAAEPSAIPQLTADFDAVIATAWQSTYWLEPLSGRTKPVLGYYVQDYEAMFFPVGSPEYDRAKESYAKIPSIRAFTKTTWNQQSVLTATGVRCEVVGPSVDTELFRPRIRHHPPDGKLNILAMIRPSSPRRAARATMSVFRDLSLRDGDR